MGLVKAKPVTPGRRGLIGIDRRGLHKGAPLKALTVGKKSTGGRNSNGRVTVRHRGGGHKRSYRLVDFRRRREGEAVVVRLEYDPNRSAFIALISYDDGEMSYILAPHRLAVGDKVQASATGAVDLLPGNAMPLGDIAVGTQVCNIELYPGHGGQLARSAGAYAQILGRTGDYVQLRLMSGEVRVVHGRCMAMVGVLSNLDHKNIRLGKAGRSRWLGRRPHVRGVAMNPIDHPHGGGEGKTSGGRHPVSPWGLPTKGKRTRGKKPSDRWIIRRRYRR